MRRHGPVMGGRYRPGMSIRSLFAPRVRGRTANGIALIRIAAGVVFVLFSIGKFTRHTGEAAAFDRYGVPWADVMTYVVGVLELGGGILLILGLATRVAAAGLAPNMAVAFATAGRIDGGPIHLGLAPTLLVVMLILLWSGAGAYSLDARVPQHLTRA